MNNTQQAGETAYLTREALRIELWSMLSDAAKKEMLPLKESYLDSLMADIDSYAAGMPSPTPAPDAVEAKADEKNLRNGIIHLREWLQNHRFLTAGYGAPISMIDEMLRGHLPYAEPTPPTEGQKATVEAKSAGVWVKASERVVDRPVTWRFTDKSSAGHSNLKSHIMIGLHRVSDYDKSVVEYLDETPTYHAEGENEAVGFAKWIGKERWMFGSSLWFKNTDEATYVKTTLELYNLYLTC